MTRPRPNPQPSRRLGRPPKCTCGTCDRCRANQRCQRSYKALKVAAYDPDLDAMAAAWLERRGLW